MSVKPVYRTPIINPPRVAVSTGAYHRHYQPSPSPSPIVTGYHQQALHINRDLAYALNRPQNMNWNMFGAHRIRQDRFLDLIPSFSVQERVPFGWMVSDTAARDCLLSGTCSHGDWLSAGYYGDAGGCGGGSSPLTTHPTATHKSITRQQWQQNIGNNVGWPRLEIEHGYIAFWVTPWAIGPYESRSPSAYRTHSRSSLDFFSHLLFQYLYKLHCSHANNRTYIYKAYCHL